MKKHLLFISIIVALSTACSKSSPADNKLAMQIDELFTSSDNLTQFSGTILVAQKGEVVFEKSYGYKNAESREKNTNNSIYRIFSITKAFTATVVLQLQQEGKLSLDDKLSKFYPDFPKADSITIKNLLGHTSGIINEVDTEITVNEETFMKHIATKPLEFSPGTAWSYSNSNYYILGYIIKYVTGQPYEIEIEQRILTPLGMSHSGFGFSNLQDSNKTKGYEFLSQTNAMPAVVFKTEHPFAAGAMYSTASDLFKFSEAIKNHTLLSETTTKEAHTPQQGSGYGLGFQVDSILRSAFIGHGGAGPGYRSIMYRFLDKDITVITFCNSESASSQAVDDMIFHIVTGRPFTAPIKARINQSKLNQLQGVYISSDSEMYIEAEDGFLRFSEKNNLRNTLVPTSDSTFLLMENFNMSFKRNTEGQVDSLIVHLPNGMVKRTVKIDRPLIWGIIGDATPGGWGGNDTPLLADSKNPNVYYLKNVKLNKGGLQFRQNNDWSRALSLNIDKTLVYSGYNIQIDKAGFYNISLDMRNKFCPKHSITEVNSK